MDEDIILVLFTTRLEVAQLRETAPIDCEKWDRGLGRPPGATAKYIDKAIQGPRISIALRVIDKKNLLCPQLLLSRRSLRESDLARISQAWYDIDQAS